MVEMLPASSDLRFIHYSAYLCMKSMALHLLMTHLLCIEVTVQICIYHTLNKPVGIGSAYKHHDSQMCF